MVVDSGWLQTVMQEKIDSINWKAAAEDVKRFLKPAGQKSLELWSNRFFTQRLEQLV